MEEDGGVRGTVWTALGIIVGVKMTGGRVEGGADGGVGGRDGGSPVGED
jgi:hypothetical protein